MRTRLVVIQPTPLCNINCRYCYLPNRATAKRISQETLEQIFKVLFASSFLSDKILFAWHAGEPLVLPIGFYEQAFQLQKRWNLKQIRVINAFQTNAILITQKWCRFFREHDVHIGVSLDGPEQMHDANRVDRIGRGTFQRAARGIELLDANNILYSIISVITDASVRESDLFWHFFSEKRPMSLGLNPEEIEGINTSSSLRTDEDIHYYQNFLKRLLILNDRHPSAAIAIREFENINQLIYSSEQTRHAATNTPLEIISFDCEGNFSTFSPELLTASHPEYGNFQFGNVFENALEDIYTNPKFQRVQEEIQQGVKQCEQTCAYFAVCGGGAPSNKLYENGTFNSTETIACRLQVKAPTDAVLEHLEAKYHLTHLASEGKSTTN